MGFGQKLMNSLVSKLYVYYDYLRQFRVPKVEILQKIIMFS